MLTRVALTAFLALFAVNSHAVIIKGPFAFDDNAFADEVTLIQGTIGPIINGSALSELAGSSLVETFEGANASLNAEVEFRFTDNAIVNGGGDDLVVFEAAFAETFGLRINGVSLTFTPVSLGFNEGSFNVNAAAINLDLFGVAAAASVSSVVWLNNVADPDPFGMAALNNGQAVPEPATLLLLGSGLLGLMRVRPRS